MNFTTTALLKVFSSLSSNFAVAFLVTLPAIRNTQVLTGNIFFAMVCLVLAAKSETVLEEGL